MEKYIISVSGEEYYNAGSKARDDVESIALEMGFFPIEFSGKYTADGVKRKWFSLGVECVRNWRRLTDSTEEGSMVLVQYPMFPLKTAYLIRWLLPMAKRKRKLRFVALIHDLNSLRGLYGKTGIYWDKRLLPMFDVVICHNSAMKQFLIENGISKEKIILLEVFDYLTNAHCLAHDRNDGIVIAGNLSPEKSAYINQYVALNKGEWPVHLYGKGYEPISSEAVFHGAFLPSELPGHLEGAFGLVWDGESIDSCEGHAGRYLKYNAPHKLSLYMVSGLPVVIWAGAAEAEFVRKNGTGICINSLHDLKDALAGLTEEQYAAMARAAAAQGKLCASGVHTHTAIEKAMQLIKM